MEAPVRVAAVVRENLPHCVFLVELERGERLLAHVAAEMRPHAVRLIPGDRVTIEVSRFDRGRGRIVERRVGGVNLIGP